MATGGDTTALFVEARGSGLLRRLRHKAGEFLSLMRECLHLPARKLALNVEDLFEVFCVNETLCELKVRLEVGFGIPHGLLVDLAGAVRDYVGRLGDDVMGLASRLEEAVVRFAGLVDGRLSSEELNRLSISSCYPSRCHESKSQ